MSRKKAAETTTDAALDAQQSGGTPVPDGQPLNDGAGQVDSPNQEQTNADADSKQSGHADDVVISTDVGSDNQPEDAKTELEGTTTEATADVAAQSDAPQQDAAVKPIVVTSGLSHSVNIPPVYVSVPAGGSVEINEPDPAKRQQIIRNLEQLKQSFKKLDFTY